MRRIHSPILLANVEDTKARAFVFLFTCDAFARAILITLVPLQAYALFDAAQVVSVVYFLVAIAGLAASLTVPLVLHWMRRRWVLTIGALAQIGSALLFALGTKASLVAGLALQALAMAMLDVVVNLYMLDHIPRRRLNVFEPRRLLFAGSAFAAGPWVGVYLARNVAEDLTYLIAALARAHHAHLLLDLAARRQPEPAGRRGAAAEPAQVRAALRRPAAPGAGVGAGARPQRLVGDELHLCADLCDQRRLSPGGRRRARVAGPGADAAGAGVGADRAQVIGVRNLLTVGYGLTGLLSLAAAAAAVAGVPIAGMALICLAAFSATVIDGAGNVPFLRAVRHYERAAMTSVFMTFRHVGALVVPGVLALVLWVLPLPWVFAVGGLMALGMAGLSRYLPRGL